MTVRIGETIISGSEVASSVRDTNHVATPIYNWTGTLNEYNALGTYNPDWLYYITDDITNEGIAPSPTGSIIAFGGSTAPNGWLICNGGEISRSTYSLLFSVIGTTYGSGDGSTTFNLPTLNAGQVPIGMSGSYIGQSQNGCLPNITGAVERIIARAESYDAAVTAGTGVFATTGTVSPNKDATNGGRWWNDQRTLNFNAASSNSMYGSGWYSGAKVIPAGTGTSYIIKY